MKYWEQGSVTTRAAWVFEELFGKPPNQLTGKAAWRKICHMSAEEVLYWKRRIRYQGKDNTNYGLVPWLKHLYDTVPEFKAWLDADP